VVCGVWCVVCGVWCVVCRVWWCVAHPCVFQFIFEGDNGEIINESEIDAEYADAVEDARNELLERIADVDDEIAELFLMEETPTPEVLAAAIRRATLSCQFVPVTMGSAFKNKGVQALLDAVVNYLPNPTEKKNVALDLDDNEKEVEVMTDDDKPLIALAFKLEETKFGQLSYMRIYQGTLRKSAYMFNVKTQKKYKVPRLVRMHSDDMEEIESAGAGEVVAMFGVDCASMDSFSDGSCNLAMTSMFVPEPVMSLMVMPHKTANMNNFAKAMGKFSKEDPTLRISSDPQTKQTVLSGMGELHLEVYIERLKREFEVECEVGNPSVAYKEAITQSCEFNYLHKKQTGGSGQYAKVIGKIEPMDEEEEETFEFVNNVIGTNIPPEYIKSCKQGAEDAMSKGGLVGAEVSGMRVTLNDGASHAVDSSDMAFRIAMASAVREAMQRAKPQILEPIMKLDVESPQEFQGAIVSGLNQRMGLIQSSEPTSDGSGVTIVADVPLAQMFGYSTNLRSITQGKGEFTMEYGRHSAVNRDEMDKLIKEFKADQAEKAKAA